MTEASGAGRLRSVQGLRGIAVLLVVLYHVGAPIGAGYIGVDVFFVISGFVITRLVLSRSAATMRLSLRDFWAARVRRLAPALGLAIILTLLLSIPFSGPVGVQGDVGVTGIASIMWIANIVLAWLTWGYFADSADQNPLLHMWSLGVEEQFYLGFPLLVVAVLWWARRREGRSRIALFTAVVALITVLSFALSVYATYGEFSLGIGPTLAFFAPVTRAWEFGIGALIALLPARLQADRRARWLEPVGAVLLVASLIVIDDPSVFPGYIALLPVVASALMCWSSAASQDGALSWRPLVWLGDRSYGWYLFHWPLIVLIGSIVTSPVAALIGLLLAHWSLRFVEDPIRRRQRWPRLSAPRLWLVSSVPVICTSVLLLVAASSHWWNPSVEAFAADVSRGHHPVQTECQAVTALSARDMSDCTFGPADDRSPIILIGDSNAGMYADMAVRAAKQAGRRITVATIPSCQVTDLAMARRGVRPTFLVDCLDRYRDTIAWLEKQPPSTVIVASGSPAPDLKDFVLVGAHDREYSGGAAKQAAWTASLKRAYSAIEQAGHQVVAVELIPQWMDSDGSAWSPSNCRLVDLLSDAAGCHRHLSLDRMDRQQRRTLAAGRDAAAEAGATMIEVRDLLCPDKRCGTVSADGTGLYSDSAHLTPVGAALLQSRFSDLMSHPPR